MTRVWLIRHGESLLNAAGRLQGWADAPLTRHGAAQALARGRMLASAGIRFDAVWSADGIRHRETARDLLTGHGSSLPVREDVRWRELCFGGLEGAAARRLVRRITRHGDLRAALAELADADADAEHPDAVVERARGVLDDVAETGDDVLVVTSGITTLLLLDALGADLSHLEAGPPNLSISTLTQVAGGWRVDRAVVDVL